MALTASRALVRQTERWFVRRGVPHMIAEYGFSRHVLPRMVPFLAFVALASLVWLIPVNHRTGGWTARAAVLAVGLAVWAAFIAFGQGLPHFSRRGTRAVLAAYALLPFVVPLLVLALHGRDAAADVLAIDESRVPGPFPFYAGAVATLLTAYALLAVAARLIAEFGIVPLTRRALSQAVADMRNSVRLQGRALPLLLFVTMFFFFTGELWQATNRISWWRILLVLGLFTAVTVLAAAGRLRDEIGRVEQDLSEPRLASACAETPLEQVPLPEVTDGSGALKPTPLSNGQVANLLIMLATRQLVQAAVVGLGLFGFFFLLGLAIVDGATAEQWVGEPPRYSAVLPGVPVALLRNAVLLAGFGSMYFAVTSMTDSEYRRQFYAPILDEVERTLAVRAVYLAVRDVVLPPPGKTETLADPAAAAPGAIPPRSGTHPHG